MTDVACCDFCKSDLGFRVDGGKLYCKSCARENRVKPLSVREYFQARGWLPEQRYKEKESNGISYDTQT